MRALNNDNDDHPGPSRFSPLTSCHFSATPFFLYPQIAAKMNSTSKTHALWLTFWQEKGLNTVVLAAENQVASKSCWLLLAIALHLIGLPPPALHKLLLYSNPCTSLSLVQPAASAAQSSKRLTSGQEVDNPSIELHELLKHYCCQGSRKQISICIHKIDKDTRYWNIHGIAR